MPVLHIVIPDGEDDITVKLRRCACGCGSIFTPADPRQVYFDKVHERRAASARAPRKTKRRTHISTPR